MIHSAYTDTEPFRGSFSDLKGGEYLGSSAQPNLFRNNPGAIIVGIDSENGSWMTDYYFDPLMKIEGDHWISSKGNYLWQEVNG